MEVDLSSEIRDVFGHVPPAIGRTINTVCTRHNVTPRELAGPSREKYIVKPRHLLMCALFSEHDYSTTRAGSLLNRHHTTVLHALDKYLGPRRYYGRGK